MLYTYIHTTYKVAQYIIQASIINSYNNVQQNSISSRHLLYIHTTYKVAQHFIQTSIIHTYDVQQNSISSRHLLYIQRTVEQYFILTSIHTTTLLVYYLDIYTYNNTPSIYICRNIRNGLSFGVFYRIVGPIEAGESSV